MKRFVDPHAPPGHETYLWIFDRGDKKGKKRAPRNILTETDIYTFEGRDGSKDYSLEKTLAQIESDYARRLAMKENEKLLLSQIEEVEKRHTAALAAEGI